MKDIKSLKASKHTTTLDFIQHPDIAFNLKTGCFIKLTRDIQTLLDYFEEQQNVSQLLAKKSCINQQLIRLHNMGFLESDISKELPPIEKCKIMWNVDKYQEFESMLSDFVMSNKVFAASVVMTSKHEFDIETQCEAICESMSVLTFLPVFLLKTDIEIPDSMAYHLKKKCVTVSTFYGNNSVETLKKYNVQYRYHHFLHNDLESTLGRMSDVQLDNSVIDVRDIDFLDDFIEAANKIQMLFQSVSTTWNLPIERYKYALRSKKNSAFHFTSVYRYSTGRGFVRQERPVRCSICTLNYICGSGLVGMRLEKRRCELAEYMFWRWLDKHLKRLKEQSTWF
jgi:hypothetical protein